MLTKKQQMLKRLFDIVLSFIGILIFFIPTVFLLLVATISTNKFGLFSQQRVGKHAKLFTMYKIRTMKGFDDIDDFVINNSRITKLGKFLRKYKLDELPQLYNVFIGNMSIVGPRPDLVGYADELKGEDRILLLVKPGITGPATLKYRNEDEILMKQKNPKEYNDTVIWYEKVKINKAYIKNWSLLEDLKIIFKTIFH